MIRPLLIGLLTGSRSLGPLALISVAARSGAIESDNGLAERLAQPMVSNSLIQLAAAELVGDKLPGAPARIVPLGLAARAVTGAIAGAALARREQRWLAAALGAGGALAASYPTFRLRMAGIRRFGQVSTGFVEDVAVAAAVRSVIGMPTRT